MRGLLTARGILVAGALLAAAACAGHKTEIPAAAAPPEQLTGFAPGDVREQLELEERFQSVPSRRSARRHLREIASRVRPAGSAPGREAAEWVVEQFEAAGLDAGLWEFQAPLASAPEAAIPVRLETEIEPETRTAVNALARVVGTDWPEELVVLGAPRDAWVDGAGRSASSVASLLEVARGLGALQKKGWQPRRTILLAAWDSSLFGPAGSTAWAEQGPFDMESAAVAYLNAGAGMSGPAFRLASSPELRVLLSEIIPAGLEILPPDGRGDDRVFLQMGVATVEIGRPEGSANVAGEAHDTFPRLEEQVDPDMTGPAEGARLWGRVALRLTDAAVPPHNHAVTAYRLLPELNGLMRLAGEMFDDNPPPVSGLRLALVDLREAAEAWNAASAAYLTSAGSIPRGDRGGEVHRRLGQAGSLVRSVDRAFARSKDAGTPAGCENMLFCPDPHRHEPARSLPGLRAATAERNRSEFVSEALRLTSAAQVAAARLREAAELLGAARPEPAEGSRLEKLLKKERP